MSWAWRLGAVGLALACGCARPAAKRLGPGAPAPWWQAASTPSARHDAATKASASPPTSAWRRQAERELAAVPPQRRAKSALRAPLAAHYLDRGRRRFARGAFEAAAADWQRAAALGTQLEPSSVAQLAFRLALQAGNAPAEATARGAVLDDRELAQLPPAQQALARTWRALQGDQATASPSDVARLTAWLLSERYMRLGFRLAARLELADLAVAQFRAWYRGELDLVPAMCELVRPLAPRASAAPEALAPWQLLVVNPIAGEAAARARCDRAIDDGACAFDVGVALLRAHQPRRAARWFAYAQAIDGGGAHQPGLATTMARALAEGLGGNLDGAEQWLLVAEAAAREPAVVSAALAHAAAAYGLADGKGHALFRYWAQRLHPGRDIEDLLRRARCDK